MKAFFVLYCLLCVSRTESKHINAEGFEGGEVSFKCSHSMAWYNDKYFCKDPCKSNSHILFSVKSGQKAGDERITLKDKGNGDFVVTLSQLQLSDSGKYWCGVARLGYDSYTEIHLTVKRAPFNETITTTAGTFPSWTHQNISNSTQQASGVDTSFLTNISTALNYTEGGEQNSNSGTLLSIFITIAAVILTSLVLAALYRKRRKRFKAQHKAASTQSSPISAHKREVNDRSFQNHEVGYKLDKICKETESIKKISESGSLTLRPPQDQPKTAHKAAECSDSHHIYENACCAEGAAGHRHSTATLQDEEEDEISSGIYINPLASAESLGCGVGSFKKDVSTKAEAGLEVTNCLLERYSDSTSACDSESGHESAEKRPKSLWFGLDLSEVV